jgi:hypothetical protein
MVSSARTVRGLGKDNPFFDVQYWRFGWNFWTVHPELAKGPPGPRGQSAPHVDGPPRALQVA